MQRRSRPSKTDKQTFRDNVQGKGRGRHMNYEYIIRNVYQMN